MTNGNNAAATYLGLLATTDAFEYSAVETYFLSYPIVWEISTPSNYEKISFIFIFCFVVVVQLFITGFKHRLIELDEQTDKWI